MLRLVALSRRRALGSGAAAVAPKPLAFVILADRQQTRCGIDKTPWRIGRGGNNDLVLQDHSVSRLHAEIRCGDDGQLILHDLDSLNGVFVNDNRIQTIQLREGDRIEIGDVPLSFTLHDADYASQEATVIVRTRAPP